MNSDDYRHIPVMSEIVINGLGIRSDGTYIDCTFGRGGHSKAILERLGPEGSLYLFDRDPEAIAAARLLASADPRISLFNRPFSEMLKVLSSYNLRGAVDGILFDLGISSPQLDNPDRGFSFSQDGRLDMRMDPTSGMSAEEWLQNASETEIASVLKDYGEEKFARRIAGAIVHARLDSPITTTGQLSKIISDAVPVKEKKKHPATRSFQAIRIYLNNELDELSSALEQAFELLRIGGRLVVISFHSLEDRIVKRFMREFSQNDPYPKDIPVKAEAIKSKLKIIGKPVRPSEEEIALNPRARSATLRVAEKLCP